MKYTYNGLPLSKYCQENELNYKNLLVKIERFQKLNVGLSNEEVVRLVIENNIHGNIKYKYQGVSLKQYCETYELNYYAILHRIKNLQKSNPSLTVDGLVASVLERQYMKYEYKGLPLSKYCRENELNYKNLLGKIERLQKLNVGLSNEEVVRLVIENNIHGNTKYKYQGVSLKQYCDTNELNYYTIIYRIKNLQKSNPSLTVDELVASVLERQYMKYEYKGLPLSEYCRENELNYKNLVAKIRRLQKLNVGLSNEEAVRLVIENNINGHTKYKYQGVSLKQYCETHELNYYTVLYRIKKLQESNPILTEEIIGLSLTKKYKKSK